MIFEVGDLIKSRNIKKRSALKSIIFEQDNKWKAVCRLIDYEELRYVFLECLQKCCPNLWKESGFQERL